jgi:hypothetical protein
MSENISSILIKQLFGQISTRERMQLDQYAGQSEGNRKMIEEYSNKKRVLQIVKENEEWSTEEDWEKIKKKVTGNNFQMI